MISKHSRRLSKRDKMVLRFLDNEEKRITTAFAYFKECGDEDRMRDRATAAHDFVRIRRVVSGIIRADERALRKMIYDS